MKSLIMIVVFLMIGCVTSEQSYAQTVDDLTPEGGCLLPEEEVVLPQPTLAKPVIATPVKQRKVKANLVVEAVTVSEITGGVSSEITAPAKLAVRAFIVEHVDNENKTSIVNATELKVQVNRGNPAKARISVEESRDSSIALVTISKSQPGRQKLELRFSSRPESWDALPAFLTVKLKADPQKLSMPKPRIAVSKPPATKAVTPPVESDPWGGAKFCAGTSNLPERYGRFDQGKGKRNPPPPPFTIYLYGGLLGAMVWGLAFFGGRTFFALRRPQFQSFLPQLRQLHPQPLLLPEVILRIEDPVERLEDCQKRPEDPVETEITECAVNTTFDFASKEQQQKQVADALKHTRKPTIAPAPTAQKPGRSPDYQRFILKFELPNGNRKLEEHLRSKSQG